MKSTYKHMAKIKKTKQNKKQRFKLLMFWVRKYHFLLLRHLISCLGNSIRIIYLIWGKLFLLFLLGTGVKEGPRQECCLFFAKVVCGFRYPWEISWSDSHLFLSKWVLRYRSPSNHVQEGIGPIITSKRNDRC